MFFIAFTVIHYIPQLRKLLPCVRRLRRSSVCVPPSGHQIIAKMLPSLHSRRFEAVQNLVYFLPDVNLQVFYSDIFNLLSMADMWRTRAPPVPLSFEGIKNGTFTLRGKPANAITSNGTVVQANGQNGASTSAAGAGLKDQQMLTLQDNLELFVSR